MRLKIEVRDTATGEENVTTVDLTKVADGWHVYDFNNIEVSVTVEASDSDE